MKPTFGFFSFTEITDPAEHHAYNEWHQLDHLPEQFPLPGIVYGQRWVSTPACRSARAVSDPSLDPIHYLTCYLMTDPIEETLDDFFDLGVRLRELDRFHQHRRAHLTGPFRIGGTVAAPRVLVSGAAIPFRAHRGIYVIVEELHDDTSGATAGDDPELLETPGVAGMWTFTTPTGLTSRRWSPGARQITVCWLDDDPLQVAERISPLVLARRERLESVANVTFAGPFETITPWEWDWFDAP